MEQKKEKFDNLIKSIKVQPQFCVVYYIKTKPFSAVTFQQTKRYIGIRVCFLASQGSLGPGMAWLLQVGHLNASIHLPFRLLRWWPVSFLQIDRFFYFLLVMEKMSSTSAIRIPFLSGTNGFKSMFFLIGVHRFKYGGKQCMYTSIDFSS